MNKVVRQVAGKIQRPLAVVLLGAALASSLSGCVGLVAVGAVGGRVVALGLGNLEQGHADARHVDLFLRRGGAWRNGAGQLRVIEVERNAKSEDDAEKSCGCFHARLIGMTEEILTRSHNQQDGNERADDSDDLQRTEAFAKDCSCQQHRARRI